MSLLVTDEVLVGDKVRSFDFERNRDCYVEGVVTAVNVDVGDHCPRYTIRVERQVWDGKEIFPNDLPVVHPPMNGVRKMGGDVCRFVEKVS
jgi:hypothetical protein